MPRRLSIPLLYAALAAAAAATAILLSWTPLAAQFDNNIYDYLFRLRPTARAATQAALVTFDERSLNEHGGPRAIRRALAAALTQMAAAPPLVVAVDLTLADNGDEAEDAALEAALARTTNLILGCEMMPDSSAWQDPIPGFRRSARALGHVHALAGPDDEINRRVALERVAGRTRRWALSLEALRLATATAEIESSPADLTLGARVIASRWDEGRPLWVRYREPAAMVRVPIGDVIAGRRLGELQNRVVFIGVTAQSAVRDRLFTPLSGGVPMPGVIIHAQAYETMAGADFLHETGPLIPIVLALAFAALAAVLFTFARGWLSYTAAALLLLAAHATPYLYFTQGVILRPFAPLGAAWLAVLTCAGLQYFYVRRQLVDSEATTTRYQQAFHFVAHEMRTPLTAIQGSSELITRYNLPDPKRKELGQMINSESKRLAKMITTFLDVEKLTAGQMELRLSTFPLQELIDVCYQRALPLAERKQIRITSDIADSLPIHADRELLEYALYNLITNAIKYSAPETDIVVSARATPDQMSISVRDQGMGMDAQEVKNLFRKFYRTKRAEQSGETGTGIGLSIVQQIVAVHNGRVEVASEPGKGSTFTVVLPATIH